MVKSLHTSVHEIVSSQPGDQKNHSCRQPLPRGDRSSARPGISPLYHDTPVSGTVPRPQLMLNKQQMVQLINQFAECRSRRRGIGCVFFLRRNIHFKWSWPALTLEYRKALPLQLGTGYKISFKRRLRCEDMTKVFPKCISQNTRNSEEVSTPKEFSTDWQEPPRFLWKSCSQGCQ